LASLVSLRNYFWQKVSIDSFFDQMQFQKYRLPSVRTSKEDSPQQNHHLQEKVSAAGMQAEKNIIDNKFQ